MGRFAYFYGMGFLFLLWGEGVHGGCRLSYPEGWTLPKSKPLLADIDLPRKTIVIDPGHGGNDPGAKGQGGVYEKDMTLKMAKELRDLLLDKRVYRVILTRSEDRFLSLKERRQKIQKAEGDLLISLHADSHPNPKMQGLSIYTLSEKASDPEAALLAEKENKSAMVHSLHLEGETHDVKDILMDLTQRETQNQSRLFARIFVETLQQKNYCSLIPKTHRSGAFAVLRTATTPAALIEMGYLSNKTDLEFLKTVKNRQKLCADIAKSIDRFFAIRAPR